MSPKMDGKNGGTHNRVLFREQHDRSSSFDTVQLFLTDDHLDDMIHEAAEILGYKLTDKE